MAFARDVYTASASQTDFTITFSYLDQADVLVYDDGVLQTQGATDDYIFSDATTIQFNSGLTGGETILLQRSTSQSSRLTDYTAGPLVEADLDNDSLQAFYMAQESIDIANTAMVLNGADQWEGDSKTIQNLITPTLSTDAATKGYVDTSVTTAATGSLAIPITVANGGTGADTASDALDNLGAGTVGKAIFQDTTAAAVRTEIGLEIGTDVQAYDADTLKADTADTLTAGFDVTAYSAGTKTTGTYTPAASDGNFQYAVNGGAHTLGVPTTDCSIVIQYTNDASAGAITTSAFTAVDGDTITTTDGDDFLFYITRCNAFSHLTVKALQ